MIEIGQAIQNRRIERSLKIQDVANHLKISRRYLKAIEEGRIDLFATESYYYGYLKQYLKYLELEDLDIKSISTIPDLNIVEPVSNKFKPNFLLIVISIILTIVVYIICNSLIETNSIDHIAIELENNPSKFTRTK